MEIRYSLIILLIAVCSCCFSQSAIKKIKLNYVSFSLETDIHVSCSNFESLFKDKVKVKVLTNQNLLKHFESLIKGLKIDKRGYVPDVRAKIYIYKNDDSVETLCASDLGLEFNEKSIIVDKRLVEFIKKLELN